MANFQVDFSLVKIFTWTGSDKHQCLCRAVNTESTHHEKQVWVCPANTAWLSPKLPSLLLPDWDPIQWAQTGRLKCQTPRLSGFATYPFSQVKHHASFPLELSGSSCLCFQGLALPIAIWPKVVSSWGVQTVFCLFMWGSENRWGGEGVPHHFWDDSYLQNCCGR